jgi:predicted Fe-Mo cluster-binding NifX family protein
MTVALRNSEMMTMRLAVPVWQGRVSPVLDVARRLLVVDVVGGSEVSRAWEELGPGLLPDRIRRLVGLGIDAIVCGAVSRQMMGTLVGLGITVFPGMRGEVEEVLRSVVRGGTPDARFFLPGYEVRRMRRRWRGRRGRRNGC